MLKPTGYVLHQKFNIQQLYALPTLYLCVLYLWSVITSSFTHRRHSHTPYVTLLLTHLEDLRIPVFLHHSLHISSPSFGYSTQEIRVVGKNGRPLATVFPTQQRPVAVTHFITSSNEKRYMLYFPNHRMTPGRWWWGVSGIRVQMAAK